jgi:hypothetical protein
LLGACLGRFNLDASPLGTARTDRRTVTVSDGYRGIYSARTGFIRADYSKSFKLLSGKKWANLLQKYGIYTVRKLTKMSHF